jgi:hypothetical protein
VFDAKHEVVSKLTVVGDLPQRGALSTPGRPRAPSPSALDPMRPLSPAYRVKFPSISLLTSGKEFIAS